MDMVGGGLRGRMPWASALWVGEQVLSVPAGVGVAYALWWWDGIRRSMCGVEWVCVTVIIMLAVVKAYWTRGWNRVTSGYGANPARLERVGSNTGTCRLSKMTRIEKFI